MAEDGSGRPHRLRRQRSGMFSSLTASYGEADQAPMSPAATSLDSGMKSPKGVMAIGDEELSAKTSSSWRRSGKVASGSLKHLVAGSDDQGKRALKTGSGSLRGYSSGDGSGSGAFRGLKDALMEKMDIQSRLEIKIVKDNTKSNRSRSSVKQVLTKLREQTTESAPARFLVDDEKGPLDSPVDIGASAFSPVGSSESSPGSSALRFQERVDVRIVRDTGTDFVYETTTWVINYTTRKHVEQFEARGITENSGTDDDLLV
mmetsp:Transcript_16630/g.40952  ORF Transcript_16630/g.40952 Transcript_16630/m.40952 type:complete len:260 (+) Transcript_16630:172-951(+)